MISGTQPVPAAAPGGIKACLKSHWPLLVLLGVYAAIRSRFWNCIPIWDGAEFSEQLLRANRAPFDLLNYSVDGHVCQGFFLVMSLPFQWFKHDYYRFNIWVTFFAALGIVAFYRLLAIFIAGRTGRIELALATALMAFHPTILASMIHFTLDIGLVVFLLWYWVLLLEGRRWPAVAVGMLLALTKETAVLLPFLVMLFCWLRQPKDRRWPWLRRFWPAAVLPCCAFAAMLIYKSYRHQPLFWNQLKDTNPWEGLRHALTPDAMLLSYAVMVFVMNFNWILSLLWLGLAGWLLARRRLPGAAERLSTASLIALIFLCGVGVVFAVRPFANPRYVVVPIVFMLLGIAHLLLTAVFSHTFRLAILLLLLGVFGVENIWTADPASRAFFGTFNFGRHTLLAVSRRTREVGDTEGRDQLVYNLEFLKFAQLTRRMLKAVSPTRETFVLCEPLANWFLFPPLDDQTGKPTLDLGHYFVPHYTDMLLEPGDTEYRVGLRLYSINELPKDVYYVEYPNVENKNQIAYLTLRYPSQTEQVCDIRGYQLKVIHFTE